MSDTPYHHAVRERMAAENGIAVTPPASFVPPVAVTIPRAEWETVAEQYPEPKRPKRLIGYPGRDKAEYALYVTVDELAEMLRQAKDAHTAFEAAFGEPDNDWPTWYAQYLLGEITVQA